jgi:mRNA-degrading endonuclease RelE of RelBE toxin-antitoxin system
MDEQRYIKKSREMELEIARLRERDNDDGRFILLCGAIQKAEDELYANGVAVSEKNPADWKKLRYRSANAFQYKNRNYTLLYSYNSDENYFCLVKFYDTRELSL